MARKKTPVYSYKPRMNEVLYCLVLESQWLSLLKDRPYEKLLRHIQFLATLNGEDYEKKKSIKQIIDDVQDKRVSKWLPLIYDDLVELNFDYPELFKINKSDTLYNLYFKDHTHQTHFHFKLWLNKTLQVYDEFRWFFLKGKFSMDFFWVETISHEFNKGELETTIWLKNGFPNRYQHFLYNRADFEGRLNNFDKYEKSDYELERELRSIYK
ncbi:MAG TPA: hypothetical protein VF602_13305 [Pedobacter sp.]|jgi:hypothetical protein